MGVFLLFDQGGRLVEMLQKAGHFGELTPQDAFRGDPRLETHSALELSPVVLERIRPQVWGELVSHSARVNGDLVVDALDTIRLRLQRQAEERAEWRFFAAARDVGLFEIALSVLRDNRFPESVARHFRDAQRALVERESELEELRAGKVAPSTPRVLLDLAGKRLPL